MSNLKATTIVAGLFIIVALILLLVIPAFKGSEVPGSGRNTMSQEAVITTVAPTSTKAPITTIVAVPPTLLPETTAPLLPSIYASTLAPTTIASGVTINITSTTISSGTIPPSPTPPNLTSDVPSVVNKDQPELQSSPAKSCPQLTTDVLEKVRTDYLAFWGALKKAREAADASIVKPYIEITSQGGTFWTAQVQYIDSLVKNNAYIEYNEILHSNPLVIKINPTSFGECFLMVYDAAKVTTTVRKKGTNELFNDKQPMVQTYGPGHIYLMVQRNGRWVIAGEGSSL